MTEKETVNHKKSLRPKEYHPMVPYCQKVFQAAGTEYIHKVMRHLEEVIKEEEASEGIDPRENGNGVVLQTLKMVMNGEGLNDRYVMGATLFLIHSLIPVADAVAEGASAALGYKDENDETTAS